MSFKPTFKTNFKIFLRVSSTLGALLWVIGCTSAPKVQSLKYAKLSNERTFEYPFSIVWKGIEETVRKYKITHRNPNDVTPTELKKLAQRSLETDWIYGESRDKYAEIQINGVPKKIPLQGRYKFTVIANRNLAGASVTVQVEEEIERLNLDGSSAGYQSEDTPDPSRASELLSKMNNSILSLPNTE